MRAIAALLLGAALWLPALADEHASAFAPEFNAFFKLSDRTRLYLLTSLTRTRGQEGAEGDLAVHLDFTLTPRLRPELRAADWVRDRYLWTRVGYLVSGSADSLGHGPSERRGILEVTGRLPPIADVSLVGRARVDLRDIGGEFSQRYRLRVVLEREIMLGSFVTVPYAQAETMYDTRYDSWNRQLYQAGVEVELSRTWRVETYLARQNDSRSPSGNVDTLGLVLKYYH